MPDERLRFSFLSAERNPSPMSWSDETPLVEVSLYKDIMYLHRVTESSKISTQDKPKAGPKNMFRIHLKII